MEASRCLDIHPNFMSQFGKDPMFLGCSENVLPLLDAKCSGRPECDIEIPDPDLDKLNPCYPDHERYLEASYTCVKGWSIVSIISKHIETQYQYQTLTPCQ